MAGQAAKLWRATRPGTRTCRSALQQTCSATLSRCCLRLLLLPLMLLLLLLLLLAVAAGCISSSSKHVAPSVCLSVLHNKKVQHGCQRPGSHLNSTQAVGTTTTTTLS